MMMPTAVLILAIYGVDKPSTTDMAGIDACKLALYESVYVYRIARKGYCFDTATGITYNHEEI